MAVTFGGFSLQDPTNGYYVIAQPRSTVKINQTLTQVARLEGVKRHGSYVGERTIPMTLKVVGTSRANLENKLDTLYYALSKQQQPLQLHDNDGRYFIADAIYEEAPLGVGDVIKVAVNVTFVCQQPYAFSESPSILHATPVFVPNGSGGYVGTITVAGSGTVFNRPSMQIINKRTGLATALTSALIVGHTYNALSVWPINTPLHVGDTILLTYVSHPILSTPLSTQMVTVSAPTNAGATAIAVQPFVSNHAYPTQAFNGERDQPYTSVSIQAYWTNVQLLQLTDNQYSAIAGTFAPNLNDYVEIDSDPVPANEYRWFDSRNPSTDLDFAGTFLTMNPESTAYQITLVSPSVPSAQIAVSWTSRWLN